MRNQVAYTCNSSFLSLPSQHTLSANQRPLTGTKSTGVAPEIEAPNVHAGQALALTVQPLAVGFKIQTRPSDPDARPPVSVSPSMQLNCGTRDREIDWPPAPPSIARRPSASDGLNATRSGLLSIGIDYLRKVLNSTRWCGTNILTSGSDTSLRSVPSPFNDTSIPPALPTAGTPADSRYS